MSLVNQNLLHGISAAAISAHLGSAGPTLPWVTIDSWTPSGTAGGWEGRTVRQIIDASQLTQQGSAVRLTLSVDTAGLAIDSMYIGIQGAGNVYDFFDVPVQVLFDGEPGFDIDVPATIVSDPIDFEYIPGTTGNLVISYHITNGVGNDTVKTRTSETGWTMYYKDTGATDEAGIVDVSSYSTDGSIVCALVTKIEMLLSGEAKSTNLRVPFQSLTADLTNFPVLVDLSSFDDTWWDGTTDSGGNIRVRLASDSSEVPFDVVYFDKGAKTGRLFFLGAALSSTVNNDYRVETVAGAVRPAVGASNGRNAVWAGFTAMFAFESLVDRTGNGYDAVLSGTSAMQPYSSTGAEATVNVHQGLGWDGTYFYVIDTNAIKKYNASWVLQTTNSDPIAGASLTGIANHCGDPCVHGGELFVPIEVYPAAGGVYNKQWVAVYNLSDLSFNRKYDISANLHEVSSICWDGTNSYFVMTDYTTPGKSLLHKYDTSFAHLGTIATVALDQKQGIEYYSGFFWITLGAKKLMKVALDGSSAIQQWAGAISGYMEGITSKGDGNFYILFDGTPSAIYKFVPSGLAGVPGWLNLAANGQAKTPVLTQHTTWTIGCSAIPLATGSNGAIVGYTPDITADTGRAVVVARSTNLYGIWDNTDSWLMSTLDVNIGVEERLHMIHDGTTLRKIYTNGLLAATDNTVVQRPAASPILFIGAEDASLAERFNGSINYVYLANGAKSDAWILAEGVAWRDPKIFYDIIKTADLIPGWSLAVTNPAATTDATGWTNRFGSGPVRVTSVARSQAGAFAQGNVAIPWWDQELTVPAGAAETAVDAGYIEMSFVAWRWGFSTDADEAGPAVSFFDGSSNLLSRRFFPRTDPASRWTYEVCRALVPAGTRKIRIGYHGLRFTGTELSAYIDDIGPVQLKSLQGYSSKLLLWKDGASTTGKTDVSGTLGVLNNNVVWNLTTNNVLYWASDASAEAYFAASIDSGDYTAVDLGTCHLDAYVLQSGNAAGSDTGRAYIEFRDGSGNLIGSRSYFAGSAFNAPVAGLPQLLDLVVPANTRSVRFGMVGTRATGTPLDAYFQWINLFLKLPR